MNKLHGILVGAIALAMSSVWPTAPAVSDGCGPVEYIEGLGPACRHENGLLEVFAPDGSSLGFTHGLDPVPGEDEPVAASGPAPVDCVPKPLGGDPKLLFLGIRVIYARAFDDADNHAATVGPLRSLVAAANGLVNDAAIATGGTAALRVVCAAGLVDVTNAVLPTPMASASFSTIVSDLRASGFDDSRAKYWVFYDDTGACSCGGTGNLYQDDRPTPANLNNGFGTASMFAVNFGYISSARIMMHELGHNMGAVQNSSPHSTGAGHCFDGQDTMCYNDGGPNGGLYSTGYCGTEVFDCGKDDYFNLCPGTNSYLLTHWNLGSTHNNFIKFDRDRVPPAKC